MGMADEVWPIVTSFCYFAFDLIVACYSAAGGGLFASHGETDDDDKPNSFHGLEIESLLEEIRDLLRKSKVFAYPMGAQERLRFHAQEYGLLGCILPYAKIRGTVQQCLVQKLSSTTA